MWRNGGRRCARCKKVVRLNACHVDHVVSGKLGTNALSNLRVLCRRCHVLRADFRHSGMRANALRDGIIPYNWRDFVWEETDL